MCIWHPKPYNVFTYVVWKTLLWISCFAAKVLSFQFELPRPCGSHVKISNLLDSCFAWKQESHLDKTNDLEAGKRILSFFFINAKKSKHWSLNSGNSGCTTQFSPTGTWKLACMLGWQPQIPDVLSTWGGHCVGDLGSRMVVAAANTIFLVG